MMEQRNNSTQVELKTTEVLELLHRSMGNSKVTVLAQMVHPGSFLPELLFAAVTVQ